MKKALAIEEVADRVAHSTWWVRKAARVGTRGFPRQLRKDKERERSLWLESDIEEWLTSLAEEGSYYQEQS